MDFPAVNQALDAIVKMYEHKLKELNPSVRNITYDISDLNNFLDSLQDVCALVWVKYIPTYLSIYLLRPLEFFDNDCCTYVIMSHQ